MVMGLEEILERVRDEGGDTANIEVKSAAGGLSASLVGTMCALANLPGGGLIVLGLDERSGFAPTGLSNPQALKQGLVAKARALDPPVQLTITQADLDGHAVIIAEVPECPASAKPVRVRTTGDAWLRGWDGDFRLSDVEVQGFLRQREQPRADRDPVPGSSMADLDPELSALWQSTVTERDPLGLGRFAPSDRLVRAGAVTTTGELTTAGLLALGAYPQQFYERYVVNLGVVDRLGARPQQARTVTGPIPLLLEQCLIWGRSVFPSRLAVDPSGHVHDDWVIPLEAFRELISNALVHRDLEAWSRGRAIEVRLLPDRLVVTNPGGLYGLTVDRLGKPDASSARNARLAELCRYARTATDSRVVELFASGIATVIRTVEAAGLPAPEFRDQGISFTAIIRTTPVHEAATIRSRTAFGGDVPSPEPAEQQPLTGSQRDLLAALGAAPATARELADRTGRSEAAVRKTLRALRENGLVRQQGGRGVTTTYQAASPAT